MEDISILKLTKLLEKNVGLVDEEAFIGQRVELDGDIGSVDWVLISIYTTIVGFHSLLEDFNSGRELNLQDN